MRALVIYESMYGNTKEVGVAIAKGLADHADTTALEVNEAPTTLDDVDLVVVGAPTHAFSLSTRESRSKLQKDADRPMVSTGTGVRDWLKAIDWAATDAGFATFGTRFKKPRQLTGSAARAIEKRLRRHGATIVAPGESFFIAHGEGPLMDGENERARLWGAALGSELVN